MTMLRKATRQKAKMRLGIAGPSGSGKTYSALLIASGMTSWEKIAVIDTENGSADLYESLGNYNVLPITAPYAPEKYVQAIAECVKAGMEVIVIDSITHEWSGKGGCLDIHEQVTSGMKIPNSFTAWAQVTPRHQAFIDAILQCPVHIITTVRSKTDYVLTEKNGKQVPQKVGMASQTRDGFEYELTVSFDLDQDHKAFTSKDRTGLFSGKGSFVPSAATGSAILDWCNAGQQIIITDGHFSTPTNDVELMGQMIDAATNSDQIRKFIHANKSFFDSNDEMKQKFINRGIALSDKAKQPALA